MAVETYGLILGMVAAALMAIGAGAWLASWREKKTRQPPKESNADAARRRSMELASRPKRPPPPDPTPLPVRKSVQVPQPQTATAQQEHARFVQVMRSNQAKPSGPVGVAPLNSFQVGGITIELRGSAPSPPSPPSSEPEKDSWENWEDDTYNPYADGKRLETALEIGYRDANGQQTRRRIDTERYVHDGRDGILHAYCHMRHQRRSFKFARILDAVSLSTGEVINDLPSWLDAEYIQSDAGQVDAFTQEHEAALVALFYVAKADGAFRAPEKQVLQDLFDEWGLYDPIHCDLLIKHMVQWAIPSAIAYGKALREVFLMPEDYQQQVYDAAQRMVGSKKTVRDTETRALERMRKELDLHSP